MALSNLRNLVYKPFTLLYQLFLLFIGLTVAGWFLSFFRGILVDSIGIPQEYFWAVMILSWVGSAVNLPLFVVESDKPVPQVEKAESFGVVYEVPSVEVERNQTMVLINLGGAIIPFLISMYLLLFSIPACADALVMTYLKTFVVMIGVIVTTYQSAQIVEGVGITTLAWGPPTMTVFITMLVLWVHWP